MSDAQKLTDCIAEYVKANKRLDDKLKTAEQEARQTRQDAEAQSTRQD